MKQMSDFAASLLLPEKKDDSSLDAKIEASKGTVSGSVHLLYTVCGSGTVGGQRNVLHSFKHGAECFMELTLMSCAVK